MRKWVVLALVPLAARAAPLAVLTQHNDNARTGANVAETLLSPDRVEATHFGRVFTRDVDGSMYAQPLYLEALTLPSGTRNVVFLATMHNSVYCFDADDPLASSPLWSVSLEPSVALPDGSIGTACNGYRDIAGEIGIISTPVIDLAQQLIYVVTFSRSGAVYSHHLHALSLIDGSEQLGGPVTLSATVPGSGAGSSSGNVAFQSQYENQRAGLLLSSGTIYIAFASYCDSGPYHGWVLAYDATNLTQTAAWNDTPDGSEGGIWQSGQGLSADGSGNLYVGIGNGTTDYFSGGNDLAEGFVRLTPGLAIADYFVPFNYASLNAADYDLGSTGLVNVPGSSLYVGGNKRGLLYVVDGSDFGHFNASDNSQIVQSFSVTSGTGVYGSPIFWNDTMYVWGAGDHLRAYTFNGSTFDPTPASTNTTTITPGLPGGILSLSANGTTAGSGVVWASAPLTGSANQNVVPGVLYALDAANVNHALWNSQQKPTRDSAGNFAKFNPPTIANGRVYLATFSNLLDVYGLEPMQIELTASPSPVPPASPVTLLAIVSGPHVGTPTGDVTFLDRASPLGSFALDGAGQAVWSGVLPPGSHDLSATYPGDGNFTSVASPSVSLAVTQVSSTTTLSVSPSPAGYGDTLLLSAHIASLFAPTGSVTFTDFGATVGMATVDGNGNAQISLPLASAGAHPFEAVYSGDDAVFGSHGSASFQIDKDGTLIMAFASPSPVAIGSPLTVVAIVSTTVGTPTGTVQLRNGSELLDEQPLDSNGHAQLTASLGSTGTISLTAEYSGDLDFLASSTLIDATVIRALPTVTLLAAPSGSAWTLTAMVDGGTLGTPTGSVSFRDGATPLGSAALGGDDTAILSVALSEGAHTLIADYSGDDRFAVAHSDPLQEVVMAAPADAAAPPDLAAAPDLGGSSSTSGCALAGRSPAFAPAFWFLLYGLVWRRSRARSPARVPGKSAATFSSAAR